MILKLGEYRNGKKVIVDTFDREGLTKAINVIILSSVPLVAGYIYIMEDNPDVDLSSKIDSLVEFYKYSKIEE